MNLKRKLMSIYTMFCDMHLQRLTLRIRLRSKLGTFPGQRKVMVTQSQSLGLHVAQFSNAAESLSDLDSFGIKNELHCP